MLIHKYLFSAFVLLASALKAEDHWVNIPRSEPIVHRLENVDEDRSIWVVFSKRFDSEKVLIRFPEDPSYRSSEGLFEATSSQRGIGEFSLLSTKKIHPSEVSSPKIRDMIWKDAETGQWVRERHIETGEHLYVIRLAHPNDSEALFHQFADSFEFGTLA